jgi:hypothetical protein
MLARPRSRTSCPSAGRGSFYHRGCGQDGLEASHCPPSRPLARIPRSATTPAAVGTTLLMMRFLFTVWPRRLAPFHEAAGLRLPWSVMVVFAALSAWLLPKAQAPVHKALSSGAIAPALWPVSVGLLLALVAVVTYRRRMIRWIPSIPAGDLVAFASWVNRPCLTCFGTI